MLRLTETRGVRAWPASFQACAIGPDLLGLLDVERLAALVVLERRALQVHARACAAHSAVAFEPAPHQIRSRRPCECGSRRSRPGGLGNIGRGLGSAKPSPSQQLEEHLGMAAGHVGIRLTLGRHVAEIAPAVDHLFRRAAADAELQAPAGDEIGSARVLGHVERVLVAHVDHGRADLDAAASCAAPRASSGNGEAS